jgi:hypothetical protein
MLQAVREIVMLIDALVNVVEKNIGGAIFALHKK